MSDWFDTNAPSSYPTINPAQTGTSAEAIVYLNAKNRELGGSDLTPAQISEAAQLVGYQEGQPVTGDQVNRIVAEMYRRAGRSGPTTTSVATPPPTSTTTTGTGTGTTTTNAGGAGTGSTGTSVSNTGTTTTNTALANIINPTSGLFQTWDIPFVGPQWNQTLPDRAPFVAPTNVTEQNDPGVQFRLKMIQQGLERSAAAKGTLLTGGTLKDINDYVGQAASGEYGNVWNRAWQTYTGQDALSRADLATKYGLYSDTYNRALGEYQQGYNVFNQQQGNVYNRLASLANLGQTSAGNLGATGLQSAGLIGSTLLNSANNIGSNLGSAAAAGAAGTVGSANAWTTALGNIGNAALQQAYLNRGSSSYQLPGYGTPLR